MSGGCVNCSTPIEVGDTAALVGPDEPSWLCSECCAMLVSCYALSATEAMGSGAEGEDFDAPDAFGLRHGRVHKEVGRSRAGRSVRTKRDVEGKQ